jgi:hypothetical protein
MLKRLSLLVTLALLVGHPCAGRALTAPPGGETHNNSLVGGLIPPGSSSLSIGAEAVGTLPGSFIVSLNLNAATITGGSWRLVAKQTNGDGSVSELGVIEGVVTGGRMSLNGDGSVASLSSVRLTVQGGSGNYAGVTGGAGTLAGEFNREPSPQFRGTLRLDL